MTNVSHSSPINRSSQRILKGPPAHHSAGYATLRPSASWSINSPPGEVASWVLRRTGSLPPTLQGPHANRMPYSIFGLPASPSPAPKRLSSCERGAGPAFLKKSESLPRVCDSNQSNRNRINSTGSDSSHQKMVAATTSSVAVEAWTRGLASTPNSQLSYSHGLGPELVDIHLPLEDDYHDRLISLALQTQPIQPNRPTVNLESSGSRYVGLDSCDQQEKGSSTSLKLSKQKPSSDESRDENPTTPRACLIKSWREKVIAGSSSSLIQLPPSSSQISSPLSALSFQPQGLNKSDKQLERTQTISSIVSRSSKKSGKSLSASSSSGFSFHCKGLTAEELRIEGLLRSGGSPTSHHSLLRSNCHIYKSENESTRLSRGKLQSVSNHQSTSGKNKKNVLGLHLDLSRISNVK